MLKELRERRQKGYKPHVIVEYHPQGRVDKIKRWASNKLKFGFRTKVVFEEDLHETPLHGTVHGTTIRNGSTLHR